MQEEKEEHQDAQEEEEMEEPVLESAEWVQFRDPTCKTYYWNRPTHSTSWNPPPGIKVVWVGERTKEGGVWYWQPAPKLFLLYLLNEAPWSVWTSTTALIVSGFPRAVFLYFFVRPLMLRIKAGMNQRDSDAGLVLLVMLFALCFPL